MGYYKWVALDRAGVVVKGALFARDEGFAQQELDQSYSRVFSVQRVHVRAHVIGQDLKSAFFRDLSLLLHSGVRLPEAFLLLSQSIEHPYFSWVIQDCASGLQQGSALGELFAAHDDVWSGFDRAVISAGDRSGEMEMVTEILARWYDEASHFYADIRKSLMVPLGTFCFFVVLVFGFLWGVVPRFKRIFEQFPQDHIPLLTKMVFSLSYFVQTPLFWGVAAGLLGLGVWVLRRRTQRSSVFFMQQIRSVPFIKEMARAIDCAQFYEIMGLLLQAHVPLLLALREIEPLMGGACGDALARITTAVESGESLSSACSRESMYNDVPVMGLIAVGEQTGLLDKSCFFAARYYRDRVHRWCAYVLSTIQPLMLLFLGSLIVLFVVALYAPLLSYASLISQVGCVGS